MSANRKRAMLHKFKLKGPTTMPGIKKTMDEWKAGQLHSGSKKGPVVKLQKQAVAIGLSEQAKAKSQRTKRLTGKKL